MPLKLLRVAAKIFRALWLMSVESGLYSNCPEMYHNWIPCYIEIGKEKWLFIFICLFHMEPPHPSIEQNGSTRVLSHGSVHYVWLDTKPVSRVSVPVDDEGSFLRTRHQSGSNTPNVFIRDFHNLAPTFFGLLTLRFVWPKAGQPSVCPSSWWTKLSW